MEPLLYRVAEAATITGYSEALIYRMALADEIPHIRQGRTVRIPRGALVDWIAHQERGGVVRATEGGSKKGRK